MFSSCYAKECHSNIWKLVMSIFLHSLETGWASCILWRLDGVPAFSGDWMGFLHSLETGWASCILWRLDGLPAFSGDWMGFLHSLETGWGSCILWRLDGVPDILWRLDGVPGILWRLDGICINSVEIRISIASAFRFLQVIDCCLGIMKICKRGK